MTFKLISWLWALSRWGPGQLPLLPCPRARPGLVSLPVSRASLTKYRLLNNSDGGNRIVLKANMELEDLFRMFRDGFSLEWPNFGKGKGCENRGGRCGYDSILGKVDCFYEVVHICGALIEYGWLRRCTGEPFLDSRRREDDDDLF